jgi:hypothetical protein
MHEYRSRDKVKQSVGWCMLDQHVDINNLGASGDFRDFN